MLAARAIEEGERMIEEAPLLTLTPDGEGRYDGTYASEMERDEARALLATLCIAGVGSSDGAGARAGARAPKPQNPNLMEEEGKKKKHES